MVKWRTIIYLGISLFAASLIISCFFNDDDPGTGSPVFPPTPDPVIGTWYGAAGRPGGGGATDLDSFGIVIEVNEQTFSITRGNKLWGSSLFIRDSTRDAGVWAKNATGDSIIFAPDTVNDSCFQKTGEELIPWTQCKGFDIAPDFCDCFPPITLKLPTNDYSWPNVSIENAKFAGQFDTMTLTRSSLNSDIAPGREANGL